MSKVGLVVLILGIVGVLLGGGVLLVSLLLPALTDGRTSWDEAMLGIIPGALLLVLSLVAGAAAARGAEWIVLPEFFTTGVGFFPELAERSLPPDGAATELLLSLARRHGAVVGGAVLCRDFDGEG